MQIIQQPDKITILYSDTYEVRQVRMNQPHLAHVTPSWNGDSVGHYEGDTLVIDTVGIKVGSFPPPGLYSMVDRLGTPHTSALHVVERYRLLDHETAKAIEERNEKDNTAVPMVNAICTRSPTWCGHLRLRSPRVISPFRRVIAVPRREHADARYTIALLRARRNRPRRRAPEPSNELPRFIRLSRQPVEARGPTDAS